MWIKRAVIKNVGRHRFAEFTFKRGLIGILGRNSSGKSTLMDGIFATVTNDWSRFPGIKEDNICSLSGPKDESSFYVEAEHDGVQMDIYRALRPLRGTPANSLTVDGKTITKAPDIQRELDQRLGINRKLLDNYVFVRQWDINAFLKQTDGERAATCQLLCGTDKAEKIYKAIAKFMDAYAGTFAEVIDNSDVYRAKTAQLEGELAAADTERHRAAAGVLVPEKRDLANSYVDKYKTWTVAGAELSTLNAGIAAQAQPLAAAKAEKAKWDLTLVESQQLLSTLKQQADTARSTLGRLEQCALAAARKTKLQAALQGLKELQRTRNEPGLHDRDGEYDELEAAASERGSLLKRNLEILKRFKTDGIVTCPTCGTAVTEMDAHLKQLEADNIDLRRAAVASGVLLEAIRAARASHQKWKLWADDIKQKITAAAGQLSMLQDIEPPDADEVGLRQAVADYDEQYVLFQKMQSAATAATKTLLQLQAADAAARSRLATVTKLVADNAIPVEKRDSAVRALARDENARLELATIDERIRNINYNLQQADAGLAAILQQLERSRKAMALRDRMMRLREEVFHNTALPKVVAQANLKAMEGDIAEVLHDFGDPFWVETNEQLSFTVHFPGQPPMPAERLSGGLQGVLGVAFRTAVVSMFTGIDMLSLDEPTAAMDVENIGYLAAALSRYAVQIRDRRQVFMITHAQRLRSAFDQCVELGV